MQSLAESYQWIQLTDKMHSSPPHVCILQSKEYLGPRLSTLKRIVVEDRGEIDCIVHIWLEYHEKKQTLCKQRMDVALRT